jgi:hypothetical protein
LSLRGTGLDRPRARLVAGPCGSLLGAGVAAALILLPSLVCGQATSGSQPPTDPTSPAAWVDVFGSYVRARRPDRALGVLHVAAASGDSATRLTRLALHEGNAWYRRGAATRNIDTLAVAIRYLAYADSLVPNDPAKYLIATSRIMIGLAATQRAAQNRSCTLAKLAQSSFTQALASDATAPVGPPVDPGFGAVRKSMPEVEQQIKTFCK